VDNHNEEGNNHKYFEVCSVSQVNIMSKLTQKNWNIRITIIIIIIKALCWDVTVTCPLADSYVAGAAREAGSAVELAAARKDKIKFQH